MKKPVSKRKKLTLERQTVRTLSHDDLSRIAAGNEEIPSIIRCSWENCAPAS